MAPEVVAQMPAQLAVQIRCVNKKSNSLGEQKIMFVNSGSAQVTLPSLVAAALRTVIVLPRSELGARA
jgi:hypothetical protein